MKTAISKILFFAALAASVHAVEFHVAINGNDANRGTKAAPLRTIHRAAELAESGDTITVHAGTYRERVNPPRGGESDERRIVYQAAPGERVVITGSETIKGWEKVQGDTWKVTIPNAFFGKFNPYRDLIHGDWFSPRGRQHHTGAVYLNGHWLTEAAKLDDVLKPAGDTPLWFTDDVVPPAVEYLLNVAWIRPGKGDDKPRQIQADRFSAHRGGVRTAPCSAGGQCIGWIVNGNWVRYEGVDFGSGTRSVEVRAASATEGGDIELRLGGPDGELLGTCSVSGTGDWQKWASFNATIKPTSGRKTLCLVFKGRHSAPRNTATVTNATATTIWAQFKNTNPNEQPVEINVRQTVFYPEKPAINYLTVRGFTLEHAATPWAPPTAEQMGLIGTHWSKGWVIENNTVRYSKCSGIALGKYGDEWDNRAESAEGYVGTINRALANCWNRDTIGHHLVRSNQISHCEQTGIVGSLGCSFSTITGNEIHDIHVLRLFSGAEMAGIKFHGAIDVQIRHNHIYRTCLGIWLDWMAQGTRLTGNLLHDNDRDLFFEVDHGPFLVDDNLLLSTQTQRIVSQGGAFAHNLIAGELNVNPFDARLTPLHLAHSTALAGLSNNPCGDVRYYNNLFVRQGDLSPYDKPALPVWMGGNVFLENAKACKQEAAPLLKPEFDPQIELVEKPDGWYLHIALDQSWAAEQSRKLVCTEMLGKAKIPNLPFENPDGSPARIDSDYFGKQRNETNPFPGPFECPKGGEQSFRVWP